MKVEKIYYDQITTIINSELEFIEYSIAKVKYNANQYYRTFPVVVTKPLSDKECYILLLYIELINQLEKRGYKVQVIKKNNRYHSMKIEWHSDDDKEEISRLKSILDSKQIYGR